MADQVVSFTVGVVFDDPYPLTFLMMISGFFQLISAFRIFSAISGEIWINPDGWPDGWQHCTCLPPFLKISNGCHGSSWNSKLAILNDPAII